MTNQSEKEIIDLRVIFRRVKERRKLFYKTIPVAFVLASALILCVPRYYDTEASLAPEMDNSMAGGTLSSLASSFGFDISDMQTSDAISPLLYPDLMEDNGFVAGLFKIRVKSVDGEIDTDYFSYLSKYQKRPWWAYVTDWIVSLLPKTDDGGKRDFNPYHLTKLEHDVAEAIRDNVSLHVDKKTAVIYINVKAQDKLICKTVADSVRVSLQNYITDYRTRKARNDMEHYKKLVADAKEEYEKARRTYGSYADANTDVVLASFRSKQEDLENDMQLKYNAYTTLSTQLQAANAKLQERTPAFTLIKGAEVPLKPTGPKRMLFVIGMMFLTAIGTFIYILKDELLKPLK